MIPSGQSEHLLVPEGMDVQCTSWILLDDTDETPPPSSIQTLSAAEPYWGKPHLLARDDATVVCDGWTDHTASELV